MWWLAATAASALANNEAQQQAKRSSRRAMDLNADMQREFAQNGIQWRVADAKKAGIHPLYALGANTASAAPISTGDDGSGYLAQTGQDISRAITSTKSADEKEMAALQISSAKLDVEGKSLDNQIRASQLRKMNMTSPPFPSQDGNFMPGQGNSGSIKTKPMERTASLSGSPASEPGAINDVGWAYSSQGALVPVPSSDVKQRIEDVAPHEWSHYFRNNIVPNFSRNTVQPPRSALPDWATEWRWDVSKQGYVPSAPSRDYPAASKAYDIVRKKYK